MPQPPPPNQPPKQSDQRTVVIVDRQGHSHDDQHRSRPTTTSWDRAGGDLQDPRRARGVREGRSGSGFQDVAQAIDIAHGAGIDKVGLMTPKIEAGE